MKTLSERRLKFNATFLKLEDDYLWFGGKDDDGKVLMIYLKIEDRRSRL